MSLCAVNVVRFQHQNLPLWVTTFAARELDSLPLRTITTPAGLCYNRAEAGSGAGPAFPDLACCHAVTQVDDTI
jgi:hypothetical protein